MPILGVVVVLLLASDGVPEPLQRVPAGAAAALGRPAPPSVLPANRITLADFDGNTLQDCALLFPDKSQWYFYLVLQHPDGWRIRGGEVYPLEAPPARIETLPPGDYDRAPPYNREIEWREREHITSPFPVVAITLSDGRRWIYTLHEHTGLVRLYLGPH